MNDDAVVLMNPGASIAGKPSYHRRNEYPCRSELARDKAGTAFNRV